MEQRREKSPASFCGTYEITLENGRFILPEPFFSKLEAESPEAKSLCFFPHDVLLIFSEQRMHAFMKEALRCHDQTAARKIRYLTSRSMAMWSPEGAISIPAWLMEHYGFSQCENITLIGMMDRIELWKTDAWKRQAEEWSKDLEPYRDKIMKELLGLDE